MENWPSRPVGSTPPYAYETAAAEPAGACARLSTAAARAYRTAQLAHDTGGRGETATVSKADDTAARGSSDDDGSAGAGAAGSNRKLLLTAAASMVPMLQPRLASPSEDGTAATATATGPAPPEPGMMEAEVQEAMRMHASADAGAGRTAGTVSDAAAAGVRQDEADDYYAAQLRGYEQPSYEEEGDEWGGEVEGPPEISPSPCGAGRGMADEALPAALPAPGTQAALNASGLATAGASRRRLLDQVGTMHACMQLRRHAMPCQQHTCSTAQHTCSTDFAR